MSDMSNVTPLFCHVCETVMSALRDAEYHRLHGCCEACGTKWAERQRKAWLDGWRPDISEIHSSVNITIQIDILFIRKDSVFTKLIQDIISS